MAIVVTALNNTLPNCFSMNAMNKDHLKHGQKVSKLSIALLIFKIILGVTNANEEKLIYLYNLVNLHDEDYLNVMESGGKVDVFTS
jgi:hypothetical protein